MSHWVQDRDEALQGALNQRRSQDQRESQKIRVRWGEPRESLRGAYFWLSAFYFVYCARPQDWIPGLQIFPLAKITGIFTIIALFLSLGKTKRTIRDLPQEALYLVSMSLLFFVSAFLSPVWKGGAFFHALDFLKVSVAWILVFLVVTTFKRLTRLVFIQAFSVVAISVVSLIKGRTHIRLGGVLGGIYTNPNEFALAIVLSLPFCFAFFLLARGALRKVLWSASMILMLIALLLTASRSGFITLVVAGLVCMWHFGIKGRRLYLIVGGGLIFMLLLIVAGGTLKDRFLATSGDDLNTTVESQAYGSMAERRYLIMKSLEGIENNPMFGIGMHNFANYSGVWKDVHVAYLQIAAEGGIPILVFYVLFFWCAFRNLRHLRREPSAIAEFGLLAGALHGSLVGFVVGACFAPVAYHYFPYFSVAYTSTLFAIVREQNVVEQPPQKQAVRNTFLVRLERLSESSVETSSRLAHS